VGEGTIRRILAAAGSVRHHVAGVTELAAVPGLAGQWGKRAGRFKFLVRDRDGKFSRVFDRVFTGSGVRILKIPLRAP
jgi:hypothetical protein